MKVRPSPRVLSGPLSGPLSEEAATCREEVTGLQFTPGNSAEASLCPLVPVITAEGGHVEGCLFDRLISK